MAVWADIYPLVADQAYLAPKGMVSSHAKRAVTVFLQRTGLWREALDAFDLVVGTEEYTLTPPADAQITGLVSVKCGGRELNVFSGGSWPYGSQKTGWPCFWKFEGTTTLLLYPIPHQNLIEGMDVVARCVPSREATSFPDWLMDEWSEVLADGVLSTLLMGKEKPWADTALALHYAREFKKGMARARIKDAKSGAQTGLRVRQQRYGDAKGSFRSIGSDNTETIFTSETVLDGGDA